MLPLSLSTFSHLEVSSRIKLKQTTIYKKWEEPVDSTY
jgi:hypothetical protein